MIIAVDFDGTVVEHRYPAIGKELPFATATLRQLLEDGHRLILWSVREGDLLQEAVDFCEQRGVTFFAVNRDFEEEDGTGKHYSRKIKADLFIDDRNVGGLPDWPTIYALIKRKMNLRDFLISEEIIEPPVKKKGGGLSKLYAHNFGVNPAAYATIGRVWTQETDPNTPKQDNDHQKSRAVLCVLPTLLYFRDHTLYILHMSHPQKKHLV